MKAIRAGDLPQSDTRPFCNQLAWLMSGQDVDYTSIVDEAEANRCRSAPLRAGVPTGLRPSIIAKVKYTADFSGIDRTRQAHDTRRYVSENKRPVWTGRKRAAGFVFSSFPSSSGKRGFIPAAQTIPFGLLAFLLWSVLREIKKRSLFASRVVQLLFFLVDGMQTLFCLSGSVLLCV